MPWIESSVMDERLRFVARVLEGEPMTDVCRAFGISRKTGYKLFARYKADGPVASAEDAKARIGAHARSAKSSSAALPAIPASPRPRRSTPSSIAMASCAAWAKGATKLKAPRYLLAPNPTRFGAPTSRASLKWQTDDTAIP